VSFFSQKAVFAGRISVEKRFKMGKKSKSKNATKILAAVSVLVLGLAMGMAKADPYRQDPGPDGIVSIEAENFDENTPQDSHEWQLNTDQVGFSGTGFMQAVPDNGTTNNLNYATNSPRLDYEVNFSKTGTHYVWIRSYAVSGTDDSIHVAIDAINKGGGDADRIQTGSALNTWEWSIQRREERGLAKIEVTSTGVHVISVWMREDGFRFDKLVLTINPDYTPTGKGPSESLRAPLLNASNPIAADGATDVPRDATLSWKPGKFANTHDVYFGTVFDDVNNADRTNPLSVLVSQAQDANTYDPEGLLEFNQTYYWRIDEVNDLHPDSPWKGDIWSFTTEYANATQPDPADGATNVDRRPTLSWTPGITAATHDVYFGDSDPPAFIGNQAETSYDPGSLELATTYYWRIDEVEADGTTKYTGDVWSFTTSAHICAFPGAEGAGRYSTGGRGGDVYHVTNLNDSGAGSLRYGLESAAGPRIIVFDVSGNIELQSDLSIGSDITIAGQTAPGDGITICNRNTRIRGNNVIVRYIRCRAGDVYCPSYQPDSLWIGSASNVIVDHVSTSWGIDEVLSATHGSTSVTVQWSMVTEALHNSCHDKGNHGYGSLINGGDFTFHHNLYAHNRSRNPRPGVGEPGTRLDWVNNVVYNPGQRFGYGDGSAQSPIYINYVGNYGIGGPNTRATTMHHSAEPYTHIYQSGNIMDLNKNGILDGSDDGWGMFSGPQTEHSTRFDLPEVTTHSALEAYNLVLAEAGASLVRDAVDNRVIETVSNQTGAHIDSQWEVGGWPELNSEAAPLDTDQDGMPDDWELEHGLDPYEPSDANGDRDGDGYTNIEEYINWIPTRHKETPPPLGFETGDFSSFNWSFSGDTKWTITSAEKYSGNYSAQAGSIDDDEYTTLEITLDCVSGDISFYRKVSSESGYDYLKFYIDDTEKGEWSGEQEWEQVSFPVEAGTRTFTWTYSKDGSASEGSDTAWIDDIVFPVF